MPAFLARYDVGHDGVELEVLRRVDGGDALGAHHYSFSSSGGMMPPTITGTSLEPLGPRIRAITSRTSGTCEPDRIDRPTTMHAFLQRGVDDLGRRQADALVDDLHAGIAGAHGDLLGAVGMAVEARLADEEFDAAAELPSTRARHLAHGFEIALPSRAARPTPVGARYSPKTSRSVGPIRRW
jgi:hypothetical protein